MKYQFTVDGDDELNAISDQLLLYASSVFNEVAPDQWEHAMTALAAKIGRMVRDDIPADVPRLRVIEEGGE